MAEGGGLLNRYTEINRIRGSNPLPSASSEQNCGRRRLRAMVAKRCQRLRRGAEVPDADHRRGGEGGLSLAADHRPRLSIGERAERPAAWRSEGSGGEL